MCWNVCCARMFTDFPYLKKRKEAKIEEDRILILEILKNERRFFENAFLSKVKPEQNIHKNCSSTLESPKSVFCKYLARVSF